MSKKKKIILLVAMVAVLAIATYVNIWLINSNANKNANGEGNAVQTGSFFGNYRTDRQTTRSYEIAQLDEILKIEGDEYAQARADALKQKMKFVEIAEMELLLETLLKAQGYADAVVSIGSATDNINVIISKTELTREDTAKIYNIISSELSTSTDYIKILAI